MALTREQKEALLKTRATRLDTFVRKLGLKGQPMIEVEAYLILETFRSRPRAILRYARVAAQTYIRQRRLDLVFAMRVWWHQARGLKRSEAIEKACEALDRQIEQWR